MKPTETAYKELQQAYDHFNKHLFRETLPDCLITLQRKKSTSGYFSANRFAAKDGEKTDEIALNPSCFAVVPLVEIMQTLVHEMCHLWQHHFGEPGRGRYHNRQWADKMLSIGLTPSNTGRPGGKQVGDSMSDYPSENGHFMKACENLLTHEFKITWYDRFTIARLSHSETSGIIIRDSLELLPFGLDEIAVENGLDVESPVENKSNRRKYTCSCGYNVWGKPGLRIICDECRDNFSEQEG